MCKKWRSEKIEEENSSERGNIKSRSRAWWHEGHRSKEQGGA
jgi:hypothetical protein